MATRTPPVHTPPVLTPSDRSAVDAELATYGIRRVPADYFVYGAYRYSQLADALAQARREQPQLEAPGPAHSGPARPEHAQPGIEPVDPAKRL